MVIGSNPIRPKKTLDKNSNPVKLKTMKETYDIIKDSHMVAPSLDWMVNAYAKHTETTQADIDWYFKQKAQKEKKENASH